MGRDPVLTWFQVTLIRLNMLEQTDLTDPFFAPWRTICADYTVLSVKSHLRPSKA